MALEYSSKSELGSPAPAFSLPGVDGMTYSLESFKKSKALLVVFMCNHCPYVIAIQERLNEIAKEYANQGVSVIGINSNDPLYKDADSFENMKLTAKEWGLQFPYVMDETQEVARAYDAVCTPDPYLFAKVGNQFILRYRGRIDDSWKDESLVQEQSLRLAIDAILFGKKISENQIPSMGCSIKWKELTAQKLAEKAAQAAAQSGEKK
jgi:peroxiredoxin